MLGRFQKFSFSNDFGFGGPFSTIFGSIHSLALAVEPGGKGGTRGMGLSISMRKRGRLKICLASARPQICQVIVHGTNPAKCKLQT